MTVPILPTDNLYKFIFTSGLTIIFGTFFLYFTQAKLINNKIQSIELALTEENTEVDFVKTDIEDLNSEIKVLQNNLNKIKSDSLNINESFKNSIYNMQNDENYRAFLSFFYAHKEDIVPYYKDDKLIKEKEKKLEDENRKTILGKNIIEVKIQQLVTEKNNYLFLILISIISIITGIFLSIYGYIKWYYLVQKPSDEKIKLEIEKLKK